ncbi:hypothetical protein ACGFI9_19110 [Micromonospora sp. NPDC048930]|uniref:hypothetical protein n=1 Tax=Micromonospora sp. NPDC048930 TaxID=3364261 RepID=UPI0037233FF3
MPAARRAHARAGPLRAPRGFRIRREFEGVAWVGLTWAGGDVVTVSGVRHVWTMIAAVVIAPLAWLLLAYGQERSLQAFADQASTGGFTHGVFAGPALCLAAAGLLLGLIATLRLSPTGAVLTGGVYTASYLALLVNPDAVLDVFPASMSVAGRTADPTLPLRTGVSLLLGGLLLVSVVSVGRWRRWPVTSDVHPRESIGSAVTLPEDRASGAEGPGLAPASDAAEPVRETAPVPASEPSIRA